jgi:CubicO group peptidase (beta-lactamase class C family)
VSRRLVVRPLAVADMQDAHAWYQNRARGLSTGGRARASWRMTRCWIAAACVAVAACHPRATTAPAPPSPLDTFLANQLGERGIPGMQVAIVRAGAIVFSSSYGLANVQDAVPVRRDSVFPLNSITKAFTGVAIMQLVEGDRLELDAPIARYLPGLPAAWQAATIRRLLDHTSGLPDVMNPQTEQLIGPGEEAAAWTLVQAMANEFAPGERFRYNQLGYALAGKLIEAVSGRPYEQFIAERQLRVAGMPTTRWGDFADVIERGVRSYGLGEATPGGRQTLRNLDEQFPRLIRTAAGLQSTAEEVARWVIALQRRDLLADPRSLDRLWTPIPLSDGTFGGFHREFDAYALGWVAMTRREHRAVGAIGGGRSVVAVYPDDDLAIVILTNLRGSAPEAFVEEVAGFYLPALAGGYPPNINAVRPEIERRGHAHAVEIVEQHRRANPTFALAENEANAWGYRLLRANDLAAAIEIFKLNVGLYPRSGNAFDSLGEAYLAAGHTQQAIASYARSLELDPSNRNAAAQLERLAAP